tara:strand:- start:128 stop:421 length:294 start_codon:yes stop_codon:yes gene_type:complete
MALRKLVELDGKSFVQTDAGRISRGVEKVSFGAYVKVVSVSGNKSQVNALVSFTGDEAHFEKTYIVPVTVDDGARNFIFQIYTHLKTLPEFAGATDC